MSKIVIDKLGIEIQPNNKTSNTEYEFKFQQNV